MVARHENKHGRKASDTGGFTLIELIVVLAILAALLSIAAPRYFVHVDRAREATLMQNLNVMRDAIDKFYADKGRYPETIEELVTTRYLRSVPVDPITESDTTWVVLQPPLDAQVVSGVYDVRSGAPGEGANGKPYAQW